MGRGTRETLTRGHRVVQGGRETAARVQKRRGLHGKTSEQRAAPGSHKIKANVIDSVIEKFEVKSEVFDQHL